MNEYEKLLAEITDKTTKATELALSDKEEDIAEAEKLLTDIEALQAKAARWQKAQAAKAKAEADAKTYQAAAAAPATNDPGFQVEVLTGGEPAGAIEGYPFGKGAGSFGRMLIAVYKAETLKGEPIDPRLLAVREQATKAAKITGLGETVPADGGFLVQTDHSTELLKHTYEMGEILNRVRMIPVSGNANGLTINGIDETSRATGSRWGGVRVYKPGEGGTKTASKPKFRQIELKLKKYIGLCYATDELLQDAIALESIIMQAFPEEFTFAIEDDFYRGAGAGAPLGILPGDAAGQSVVTVSKQTGQAAATFVAENAQDMWARMWAKSRKNAIWMINQDCEPEFGNMSLAVGTGGSLVYMPPGGLSASPYASLYGRPVIPVEYCNTLGTLGDIVLADWTQYIGIDKGGMQQAQSIHVAFTTDETAFRFVYRVDGQPIWHNVLTPYKGTNTLAPFIVLETRS